MILENYLKYSHFKLFAIFLFIVLMISFNKYSYAQNDQLNNNYDKAKSSSDQALSIIDSLKGSSMLESAIGGMENFSLSVVKNQNQGAGHDDTKIGSINGTFNPDILNNIDNNSSNNTAPNNSTSVSLIGNISQPLPNSTQTTKLPVANLSNKSANTTTNRVTMESKQSMLILPYPMMLPSKDFVPLYSSMPNKISSGNILAKLPCDDKGQSILKIVGSSSDNSMFPIDLKLFFNIPKSGNMCMYQFIIPNDLSNLLYTHTLTNIYLYNPSDSSIQVPTTTSIFIGINKLD